MCVWGFVVDGLIWLCVVYGGVGWLCCVVVVGVCVWGIGVGVCVCVLGVSVWVCVACVRGAVCRACVWGGGSGVCVCVCVVCVSVRERARAWRGGAVSETHLARARNRGVWIRGGAVSVNKKHIGGWRAGSLGRYVEMRSVTPRTDGMRSNAGCGEARVRHH